VRCVRPVARGAIVEFAPGAEAAKELRVPLVEIHPSTLFNARHSLTPSSNATPVGLQPALRNLDLAPGVHCRIVMDLISTATEDATLEPAAQKGIATASCSGCLARLTPMVDLDGKARAAQIVHALAPCRALSSIGRVNSDRRRRHAAGGIAY